ncbi:MAG: hypothetical protein Kow00121_52920 [Elainellaceae cyanobacterium]
MQFAATFSVIATIGTIIGIIGIPQGAIAQTASPASAPVTTPTCLAGNPDGSFQGDRPLMRNEFATGLSRCLEELEQDLEFDGYATRTETEAALERQQELNTELEILRDRVDNLLGEPASPETP